MIGYNFSSGGSRRALVAGSYTLLVDGVTHSATPRSGDSVFFEIDLDAMSEGWHWLDVVGAAGETTIPLPVYRRRGTRAVAQATMPILTHSHDMLFPTVGYHEERLWTVPAAERTTIHYGMVPARFEPTVVPLQPRECPVFSDAISRTEMVCTQVAPSRMSDIHRPSLTEDGVLTTSGTQAYHYSDFVSAKPIVALLDGPRGHGTVLMPTHIQVGRNGKIYGTDPWRMFKVDVDGSVKTLVGYRHRGTPSNYRSPPDLELVGDWSAIPADRRGMHEVWGMAWDERTLLVNEGAPPIPSEGNEKPHIVGPVAFLADSQNNRVLRVEFSATSHSVPAKVTEFLTGLADPWDVACGGGVLYVSERGSHRVVAYNATTGGMIRVVTQGNDLAYVDSNRKPRLRGGVTLQMVQQQPCVAPEGLFLLGNRLYFGSRSMQQVREVDLGNDQIVRTQDVYCDGNSVFVKFAVSDGTFGPRGTIFSVTWSNRKYGYPHAYLPNGEEWAFFGEPRLGNLWADGGYSTAVGVGQGRLVCGYVQEGLTMVSRAVSSDVPMPSRAGAGAIEYWRRGYRSSHGVNGWGHYGLPLPWGLSADMDAYLEYCGHRRA